MDISIIIGTYNRCESLFNTIQSITNMHLPDGIICELIVVDNNSSDETRAVVEYHKANSPFEIRYLMEKKQGVSHAKNLGISESKGEIIAFIDDDCILDFSWLTCLLKEFQSDPELSGIGGRVELFDVRDKPVTILTSRDRSIFSSAGQLFSFIHGCNMAFHRNVFQKTGCFDVNLGPGTKVLAAEDSDIIYRVHKCGFKMLYCPEVFVYHNHGRRTDEQVVTLMNGYMTGRGAFYLKHILKGDRKMLKMAYWELCGLKRTISNKSLAMESKYDPRELMRNLLAGAWCYLCA